MITGSEIKPCGHDKHGPMFKQSDVRKHQLDKILTGDLFKMTTKHTANDIDTATELAEKATENFNRAMKKMSTAQEQAAANSKKASGQIRDSTQKLSEGLSKIEKTANFDQLERYVQLLERANTAISSLAKLQENGQLEKIANAIK